MNKVFDIFCMCIAAATALLGASIVVFVFIVLTTQTMTTPKPMIYKAPMQDTVQQYPCSPIEAHGAIIWGPGDTSFPKKKHFKTK